MTLALRNVTKVFETMRGAAQRAVNDLSFEFIPGKLYTILGPSGCGKTTLLRMIAGFEHPTSGDITHNGVSLNNVPPYSRGFPMVFQSYALFPHMTVFDNVRYGLRVRSIAPTEQRERTLRMLTLLGLETFQQRHPAQLSGGQQQRVALARALVLEPEIVLLDEPLSNLDAGLRVSMRSEIRALQQRLGITAIYVTHDQEEALAISDEILVMNEGRIEQAGTPVDVYERPATEFVARFMGCPNILPVQRAPAGGIVLFGRTYDARGVNENARLIVMHTDAFVLGAAHEFHHDAVVEEASFLGSYVRYVVRLADGTRVTADRASTAEPRMFAVGEAMSVGVDTLRLYGI